MTVKRMALATAAVALMSASPLQASPISLDFSGIITAAAGIFAIGESTMTGSFQFPSGLPDSDSRAEAYSTSRNSGDFTGWSFTVNVGGVTRTIAPDGVHRDSTNIFIGNNRGGSIDNLTFGVTDGERFTSVCQNGSSFLRDCDFTLDSASVNLFSNDGSPGIFPTGDLPGDSVLTALGLLSSFDATAASQNQGRFTTREVTSSGLETANIVGDLQFQLTSISSPDAPRPATAVPAPGTLALIGLGLAGVGFKRRIVRVGVIGEINELQGRGL